MNKISFHEIEAKLQGGLAFQQTEPTTIGRAKNKRVGLSTAKTLCVMPHFR